MEVEKSEPVNTKGDSPNLRMRTITVLWRLEQCLGEVVKSMSEEGEQLPEGQVRNITEQELDEEESRVLSTGELVAATYPNQITDLAIGATEGRAIKEHLEKLRDIFEVLEIYAVRNKAAHPNRNFPKNYWYKVATIATHPIIEKLGFDAVKNRFKAALNGEIEVPPDEWMDAAGWELPNNLPKTFEHNITGFVGRKEEKKELKERLKNPRENCIAIVAPGGIGKTALALHVLDELSKSHKTEEFFDHILYFSAKNEILTKEGIKTLETPTETIEGIKKEISAYLTEGKYSEFDEAKEIYDSERILLCIDNLETILRDNPRDFKDFYYSVPEKWKVLLTSRVSVDVASTLNIDKFKDYRAIQFARSYISKKAVKNFTQDEVQKIVESTDYNPLAIRLSIDHLADGGSLEDAVSETKEDVVQYSYQNLVNHLPSIAKEILESLYESPGPVGRVQVAQLLDRSIDQVAEGFRQLQRTSLCTRDPYTEEDEYSEERYELSSSVRDLLMLNPADEEARSRVERRRRSIKLSAFKSGKQREEESPLSVFHLPEDLPDHVEDALYRATKALKAKGGSRKEAHDNWKNLQKLTQGGVDRPEISRVSGMLLFDLSSRREGKNKLKQAVSGDSFDPPSALVLCKKYREDYEYDKAIDLGKKLIDKGWDNPDKGGRYSEEVVRNFYLPHIWSDNYKKVLEETENWKSKDHLSNTYGSIRAQALRNCAQKEDKYEHKVTKIVEAMDITDKLFREEGYAGYLVVEGMNLIRISSKLNDESEYVARNIKTISKFAKEHTRRICAVHDDQNMGDGNVHEILTNISNFEPGGENYLRNGWSESYIKKRGFTETGLKGEMDAIVNEIPTGDDGERLNFMFATNEKIEDRFFIHKSDISNEYEIKWEDIKMGDKLQVRPDEKPEGEDEYNVESALYIGNI